ncbi:acetyltransferase [Pyrenophora seminiperda CCB06]|uniref:Acetyltransferase n=1 Tax=Pyrenophora seminiperda CCB06 TaxID=1302712 RepID=A0A3M7M1Q5_9PLEO|nr:acetyltransferase [Pyrenophora seminiperda CCB06]
MDKKTFQWERTSGSDTYLISSDRSLLAHDFVQDVYASEDVYWAKPLPSDALCTMLNNSLTLGVYLVSGEKKTAIGMARMITDYTTLAYLTDVYLVSKHQGKGLGKWLIGCCRDICLSMDNLRFMVLLTGSEQARALYRRELGMSLLNGVEEELVCMGARKTNLNGVSVATDATTLQ